VRPNIALATYWEMAGDAFSGAAPMESPALSHACEYETSMMLHLLPDRVRMEAARRSLRPDGHEYIPWEDDIAYRGVRMVKRTQFVSDSGASGEPHKATPEKGRLLIEKAAAAAIAFVDSFKDWPLMEDLRNA
jgi:creatinine amidohydrolase